MGKKKLIQAILLILLIFITFFIFNFFYKTDETLKSSKKVDLENSEDTKSNDNKNIIQNIRYTSNNSNGDIFEILAEYGEPSTEMDNLMFLTKVEANIILINKSNIKLTSNYAKFNTKTFETTFIDNIKIIRNDETVFGDELYLVFDQTEQMKKNNVNVDENLIRISNNVVIKKPGYILKADVLEIDLISKNVKIFMKNEKDKVQSKSKVK
tara:strand:+ start:658 stop:1290 length:633 start_codon:yes stop_codon:yes gene_type:complete